VVWPWGLWGRLAKRVKNLTIKILSWPYQLLESVCGLCVQLSGEKNGRTQTNRYAHARGTVYADTHVSRMQAWRRARHTDVLLEGRIWSLTYFWKCWNTCGVDGRAITFQMTILPCVFATGKRGQIPIHRTTTETQENRAKKNINPTPNYD